MKKTFIDRSTKALRFLRYYIERGLNGDNRSMTIAPGIVLPEAEIEEICRRYQVRELSLFGSAVRGEMRPDSDIDMLVDYFPEAQPSLFDLIKLKDELSDRLGRPVDLGVKRALKPRYKDHILGEARVIYAA